MDWKVLMIQPDNGLSDAAILVMCSEKVTFVLIFTPTFLTTFLAAISS